MASSRVLRAPRMKRSIGLDPGGILTAAARALTGWKAQCWRSFGRMRVEAGQFVRLRGPGGDSEQQGEQAGGEAGIDRPDVMTSLPGRVLPLRL
jgi:hypothetical protein